MKSERSFSDLFSRKSSSTYPLPVICMSPEPLLESTVQLTRIGFRNIAHDIGVGENAGAMVFNRLAYYARTSKDPLVTKLVSGKRHADDEFIDLRLAQEVGPQKLPGVGKAGREILRRCQSIVEEITAEPESLAEQPVVLQPS